MKDKILIFLTIFFVILFPLSFLLEKKQNSIETFETAFLNPKNEIEIKKIILASPDSTLEFENKNDFYFGGNIEKTYVFPADQKSVKNLVSDLKKIRKLSKAESSGTILNEKNYDFKILYELNDGKTTEILFGKSDITETKRFVKIPAKNEVFKTESDLEPFFTTNADFWVCPEIVWNSKSEKKSAEDIQKICLLQNGKRKTLLPSAKDFYKNAETLLSLRHGKLCPKIELPENAETLEVEFDDNIFSVKIAPKGEDFVLVYETKDSDYAAEISGWTYNRLKETFAD